MNIDPYVALSRATPEGDAEYLALASQLRQLWSDLEPIPGQPTFSDWDVKDGIWPLGRRDYHPDTSTYRTFRVVRFAYIPLFVLGAYRVYESPRGSLIFLGRHALPPWAQAWNAVVACGVASVALFLSVSIWKALR